MLKYANDFDGTSYQIRTAGNSIRLYRDGVLHTQWNPHDPLKGSLWELFLLAAVMRTNDRTRNSLILGMGGGASVNLFHRFLSPTKQTALELDPHHVRLARQYFRVDDTGVKIIQADAISWLTEQNGQAQYDLIVDDLFVETKGQPHRIICQSQSWYRRLLAHMSINGLAIFNFADSGEWHRSSLKTVIRKKRRGQVVQLRHKNCQNVLICFFNQAIPLSPMRQNVMQSPAKSLWSYVEQGIYSVKVLTGRRNLR